MGATGLESLWSSHTILPSRAFRGVSRVELGALGAAFTPVPKCERNGIQYLQIEKKRMCLKKTGRVPPNLMFYAGLSNVSKRGFDEITSKRHSFLAAGLSVQGSKVFQPVFGPPKTK